jgi:type IV secretion system protein VirB10
MRLSKRAGILALLVVGVVVALIGYGIMTRNNRPLRMGFHADETKSITAATDAGKAISAQVPNRFVVGAVTPDVDAQGNGELQPPKQDGKTAEAAIASRAYMTNVNQAAAAPPQFREPTPEEKRLSQAYERELQAMDAATTSQASSGGMARLGGLNLSSSDSDVSPITNLLRAMQRPQPNAASSVSKNGLHAAPIAAQSESQSGDNTTSDTRDQNDRFLANARATARDNYLKSARTKPRGRYEIKEGWDIPAVLEQGINSDLPGDVKSLVRENVYDTATGRYLLIPQGARLVGTYDDHVAYGQNGVQVVWSRIIFPDASSIDLDGMAGQDASGHAGLRHDVDNHYKRLLGFGLLTSLFSASFELSQSRRGSVLGYPSAGETAASSVGGQISQLGAEVTRRNLTVQPTIKVPIGYRFNVRVNRDILFESPYQPVVE